MKKFLSLSLALTMLVSLLCMVPAQAKPFEEYTLMYENFEDPNAVYSNKSKNGLEHKWHAGGVGGSLGSYEIKETAGYTHVEWPLDARGWEIGQRFRYSAWINILDTDMSAKGKNLDFYVYGRSAKGTVGWHTVSIGDAKLKNNEWVYVSIIKDWDGMIFNNGDAAVSAEGGKEFLADPANGLYLNIRVGNGQNGTGADENAKKPMHYLIDDLIVEPVNDVNAAPTVEEDDSVVSKGSALDSEADVNAWKTEGGAKISFAAGVSPDGSAGSMFLDFKEGSWSEVKQAVPFKTNRLYEVSFDAKVVNRDGVAYSFINWVGGGRQDFPQWYGYNSAENVIKKDWTHIKFYVMGDSKIGSADRSNWGPRFCNLGAQEHTQVLKSDLQMYVDNLYYREVGVVANGDFETASVGTGAYFKDGKANASYYSATPVPYWYGNNATVAKATDVRASYEEGEAVSKQSMKVTVDSNGGYVYQPVVIEDAIDYKFSFWAKGVNATGDQAVSLQLDRTVATVDAKDTIKVNDIDTPVAAETQYLTNEWKKYEFTYRSEYGGDNTLAFPRAPYMNILVGENKAGTTYFIDDFKVEEYDPNVTEPPKYAYPYAEDGSVVFSGDEVAGSKMAVEYFFVSDIEAMEGTSVLRLVKKFGAGEVIVATSECDPCYGEIEIPESLAGEDIAIELALIDEAGRMGNVYRHEINDIKKAFAVTPKFDWNEENNEVIANVTIENNAASRGDQQMLVVLAQFDEDGAMIDVATLPVDVTVGFNKTVTLSDTVHKDYSKATIFVWSGTSLADAGELVYTDSISVAG